MTEYTPVRQLDEGLAERIQSSPRPSDAPFVRQISRPVMTLAIKATDFALLLVAGALTALGWAWRHSDDLTGESALAALVGAAAVVITADRGGCYTVDALLGGRRAALKLAVPLLTGLVLVLATTFMIRDAAMPSRAWPVLFMAGGGVLLGGFRWLMARLLRQWVRTGRLIQRVAVVGVNQFSATFLKRLLLQPNAYAVGGVYDDRQARVPPKLRHIPVRGSVDDLLRHSRHDRFDIVVIALPLEAMERINTILAQLSSLVVDVFLTTGEAGQRYDGAQFSAIASNPVVSVSERPIKDWQAAKKTCFDYAGASMMLLILLVPLLLVALAIRLDSPGPVLFRQPRTGFDNRTFSIFKFRTMYADMTDLMADRQTTKGDLRITRIGRWLRRLSIDELPQLLNVLQGSMSLVGPRPHAPNTKAADRLFADVVSQYAVRHRVKPGITGWAQVNGWRGETRTEEQLRKRVQFDLDYIQNWSVSLDVRIMWQTLTREIASSTAF